MSQMAKHKTIILSFKMLTLYASAYFFQVMIEKGTGDSYHDPKN